MTTCHDCAFWTSGNHHNGLCRHSAPRPSEAVDQIAFWPETLAVDSCGEGAVRDDAPALLLCGDCMFWRRNGAGPGLYPLDRLGNPSGWWGAAAHCVRYAPGPSSSAGQHGFWRVTHRDDGCAQGRRA